MRRIPDCVCCDNCRFFDYPECRGRPPQIDLNGYAIWPKIVDQFLNWCSEFEMYNPNDEFCFNECDCNCDEEIDEKLVPCGPLDSKEIEDLFVRGKSYELEK